MCLYVITVFIFPLLSEIDEVIEKIDSWRPIYSFVEFFSFGMCPLNVNQSKGFFLTMTFILHINFFVHPRMWMHIFPISFEVWINHKSFILFYTFFALWVYTFRQFHFVSSVFELLEYQEKSEIKQTHFSEFFNQYHIQASVINSRKLLYVYDKAH